MNAPTFRRICAHSGSSFGSNTTHCVPRYRLSSRKSAVRRTARYFHSRGQLVGAAQRAPAPDHAPGDRELAQAVDAQRVERAVLEVGQLGGQAAAPLSVASRPAGVFQTPRLASVRASTPATAPQGA